jgi:hypothetical protein
MDLAGGNRASRGAAVTVPVGPLLAPLRAPVSLTYIGHKLDLLKPLRHSAAAA